MGADGGDPAVGQHGHPVGQQDGARPVRHHQRGGGAEHLAQGLLDQRLGVHVQRGQRVVQHEEGGVADHGPGQGQPLPLTTRQAQALLADLGLGAGREPLHEVGLGGVERPAQLLVGGVGGAHQDVLPDRGGEQGGLLEGHRDQLAQPGPGISRMSRPSRVMVPPVAS